MQFSRIKYCGLRRKEDIEMINAAEPDFAGFIMSRPFRRYVPPETVRVLRRDLSRNIRAVGVFVNEPAEYPAGLINDGTIDMVQLHGNEDEQYISRLKNGLKGIRTEVDPFKGRIIKAFKITCAGDIEKAVRSEADYILLDSGTGTGKSFDWGLMRDIKRPYFFAGGLTPGNVGEVIRRFHPFAVDVSSGAETDGVKDPEKVSAFACAVRNAANPD